MSVTLGKNEFDVKPSKMYCDLFPHELLVLMQALCQLDIDFLEEKITLFDYSIFFVRKYLCTC